MVKETYDTDAKRRVIEKQRDFIKSHLIGKFHKKPEELRVAFFPGREALEFKIAYGPLGIKEENVTAVERYKPNHEYWKKNSSFTMSDDPVEALDFFKSYTGEPFDIISLDYDGMMDYKITHTVDFIAGKQLLRDKSIFVTNLYGRRESNRTKLMYRQSIQGKILGAMTAPFLTENADPLLIVDQARRGFSRTDIPDLFLGKSSVSKTRDFGLTSVILAGLFSARGLIGITPLYRRSPGFEERDRRVTKLIEDLGGEKNKEGFTKEQIRAGLHEQFTSDFLRDLATYLDTKGHLPLIAMLLHEIDGGIYFPESINSFRYTSDKGAVMYTDMFFLNQRNDIMRKYMKLYETAYTPNCIEGPATKSKVELIHSFGMDRQWKKCYEKYKAEVIRDFKEIGKSVSTVSNLPQRINLGSSLRPLVRSRKRLRELVQKGLSREEIESQYRISNEVISSLPAFLAQRTKGEYQVEQAQREQPGSSELERKVEKPVVKSQIEKEKHKPILNRGILAFDSNPDRLRKNLEKAVFYDSKVESTCLLHGIDRKGILARKKLYGMYVLNTLDPKFKEVFSEIALRFCDSNLYLNLLLIGPSEFSDEQIQAARELGAKIRVNKYETSNGYIMPDSPLELEHILSSWETGGGLYERRPEQQKVEKIKKKIRMSEQDNQQIYESIVSGLSDEEIMQRFTLTPNQLGARKAWVTMRDRRKLNEQVSQDEINN